MQLLATINPENVTPDEVKNYRLRQAARAVVFAADGNIALLHVKENGYHKLPGGGIETGEDVITAVRRECREEIGCEIEITGELGCIIEYRKRYSIKQESFCHLAKISGAKGKPTFTKDEIKYGFSEIWLPPAKALQTLQSDRSESYSCRYIGPRDIVLLQTALALVGNRPASVV